MRTAPVGSGDGVVRNGEQRRAWLCEGLVASVRLEKGTVCLQVRLIHRSDSPEGQFGHHTGAEVSDTDGRAIAPNRHPKSSFVMS